MDLKWKILFVGDIVMKKACDETFLSNEFQELMNEHELRSCNFEAPISGIGAPIKKVGSHLNQHPLAPSLVEKVGFSVINLANNHIYDFGQDGLAETLRSFKKSILVGAGLTFEEAYQLKQVRIYDVNIGFLSFCEAEFGALTANTYKRGGYAWVNHPIVNSLIKESKQQVDILIIQCHGGIEKIDLPLPEWRQRYRELIDWGADAVICGHPHVPQGWEVYSDKPIFYSLGNFYFDSESKAPFWNKGIAVSLAFENKNLKSFDVIGIEKKNGKVEVSVDPLYMNHLNNLNNLLQEPIFSDRISQIAATLWEKRYKRYYEIATNGITPSVSLLKSLKYLVRRILFKSKVGVNIPLLLHNIRIESHRWIVERALSENIE